MARVPPTTLALMIAVMLVVGGPACSSPASPTPAPLPPDGMMPDEPDPTPEPAPQTAQYEVTFDASWSQDTHPQDPIDNAHFSGLIGGTHDASQSFWQAGTLATDGIKRMAELGRKDPLDAEVLAAVAGGRAERLLSGPNLSESPAATSMTFDVSQDFPLVTLVTMVAPSPDWFVGVSGLPLFVDGAWREELRVELFPYDAGTDSGDSFESADDVTSPFQPISRLTGYPFLNDGAVAPLGTFTFRRLQ